MYKILYLFFIVATYTLFASEPSAFLAGDLDSRNPYGLTETEKHIFQNRETIRELKTKIVLLEGTISELQNSIEAIKGLNRGDAEVVSDLRKDFFKVESNLKIYNDYQKKVEEDQKKNSALINELIVKNIENNENIKIAIKELSLIIENINNSYVSKDELKTIFKKAGLKTDEIEEVKPKQTAKNKAPEEIFANAQDSFKNKKYEAALKDLEFLAKNSEYKKAEVMFLIGEINYFNGLYKEAVVFFKNSAKMDDKAPYMDALLYHTGASFQKMGDISEAKKFYETLIALYPKAYLVESAKKRLEELKN